MRRTSFALPLWLVWAIALVFVVAGLGNFAILDNNEGLYAEIPREMLAAGDWRAWIIPHLNGLPYMEKPPLLYWLTALSFSVFGETEWSARLVPALSSLACVAMLIRFGRRVGHEAEGRLAALMFVTGIGVLAMSRVLMFDMLLTAFLTAALLNTWLFLREDRAGALRWAYAALACAVLTKGLVALVLYSLVILGTLLAGSGRPFWTSVRKLLNPLALLIFFALVAPWHIAANSVEPVFAWFYFYNEHVLRFLGQRQPHDYYGGPWWYYLPRMAIYLFPWSFLLLLRLAPSVRQAADPGLRRFMLLAWLLPLLFFSVSTAKANYYLVAVMPFAAFHLALMLCQRDWENSRWRVAPALAIALTCGLLAVVALTREMPARIVILGLDERGFLILLFAGATLLSALLALLAWKRAAWGMPAVLLLSVWFAGGLGFALSSMEAFVSTRGLATWLQQQQPDRQVYLFRDFEKKSSLAYYLRHPVHVIDTVSADLHWGNRLRANDVMVTREQFLQVAALRQVVVVVTDEHRPSFESWDAARQMAAVRRSGNVTVYVNRPARTPKEDL